MIWNQGSKKNQENFTIYAYEIAGTYTRQLADITPKQLIRMGERWRSDIDMAWNIDWRKVNIGRKQLSRLNDTEYLTQLKARMQDRVNEVSEFATVKGGYDKLPDDALDALKKVVSELG